jgi:hypothetical protein
MVFFKAANLSNIVLVFHRILDLKARGWIYILAPFYFIRRTPALYLLTPAKFPAGAIN